MPLKIIYFLKSLKKLVEVNLIYNLEILIGSYIKSLIFWYKKIRNNFKNINLVLNFGDEIW